MQALHLLLIVGAAFASPADRPQRLEGERPPKPERPQRPEGGERPDRPQRPEGGERPQEGDDSDSETHEITIVQSWSQETDYPRVTQVKVPATEEGVKLPVVIQLHGNGGQGSVESLSYLGDGVIIAAPSGYERSWNVNAEKSKADDVAFILELIRRVVEEIPAADADDVTLLGTSNGAAISYRLLIETGIDRPFRR